MINNINDFEKAKLNLINTPSTEEFDRMYNELQNWASVIVYEYENQNTVKQNKEKLEKDNIEKLSQEIFNSSKIKIDTQDVKHFISDGINHEAISKTKEDLNKEKNEKLNEVYSLRANNKISNETYYSCVEKLNEVYLYRINKAPLFNMESPFFMYFKGNDFNKEKYEAQTQMLGKMKYEYHIFSNEYDKNKSNYSITKEEKAFKKGEIYSSMIYNLGNQILYFNLEDEKSNNINRDKAKHAYARELINKEDYQYIMEQLDFDKKIMQAEQEKSIVKIDGCSECLSQVREMHKIFSKKVEPNQNKKKFEDSQSQILMTDEKLEKIDMLKNEVITNKEIKTLIYLDKKGYIEKDLFERKMAELTSNTEVKQK